MIKHIVAFIFLFSLLGKTAVSQTYYYSDYTWESKPPAYKAEKSDTSSEIILKDKIAYQATIESNIGYEYYLHHKQTWVNSPSAIERNNKVYIPSSLRGEIVKMKVRVIKPNGDVVEMNDSDIKEAVDQGDERKYKYLAVRGLENNSIVEELFVIKTPNDFTGRIYTVQSEYPKHDCTFELIYPKYFVFDTKSWNGFPDLKKDTTFKEEGLARMTAAADFIAPLKDEKYGNREANVQKVAYKLTGSTLSGNMNINSYDKLSDVFFCQVHKELAKPEVKALDKILSNSMLDYGKNEEDKIRKLEDYVKKTIFNQEDIPNNSVTIDKMLEKKLTDESSLTRMYVAAFDKLGIETQLVVTCNHYDIVFEKDFEALNYLDKFFLYFPKYDKYLAPGYPTYRYGLIPYQFRNTNGLFIKKTTLGNLTTGMGTVKFIKPDSYLDNTDSLIIGVDFSKGFDNVTYNYRVTNSGHEATTFQCLFDYIKEEKDKVDMRKALIKSFSDEAEIKDLKSENEGPQYFAKKPYVVTANFQSGKYLDKAGTKYIFKVGDLIGPQEQMYQEEARKMPIEMNYCKNYYRYITFKIPAGYKLTNAEKLNMDIFQKDEDGNRITAFHSWYEIKDDEVKVMVEEYYKTISMPVSAYEPFKAVINASADFNKIALLFEPN